MSKIKEALDLLEEYIEKEYNGYGEHWVAMTKSKNGEKVILSAAREEREKYLNFINRMISNAKCPNDGYGIVCQETCFDCWNKYLGE